MDCVQDASEKPGMKRKMAALVIGNGGYPDGHDLTNPVNDANDLGAKLKGYGFDVSVAIDCRAKEMEAQLKAFRKLLQENDVGLFFFAGHGMQIEGVNYLLALDTDMDTELDAKHSSLSLDKVVDTMAKSTASTKIIVLDACRTNPWERRWHRAPGARGLASVYAPKGTIIGFATSPGEIADDGADRNGTYTDALLQHIDAADCTIETMFKRVRNTVAAATSGKQTSWEHTSLSGEFYFNMSLGKLIDDYDGTALADRLFVLDDGKKSHKIIAGLKTHDWYRQNPAIALFDVPSASKMGKDSLFVLGRNIYQAAAGRANSADGLLRELHARTRGLAAEKRKALLDGMLFEIFFDSEGRLRDKIKAGRFDELFELQRHGEFADSFEWIAEVLVAAGGDFYALPGKGHELAVTVRARKRKDAFTVEGVFVDGVDVLRAEDDAWAGEDGERFYSRIDAQGLNQRLSEELVVPARLLKVSYAPAAAAQADELRIPMGWTARKG